MHRPRAELEWGSDASFDRAGVEQQCILGLSWSGAAMYLHVDLERGSDASSGQSGAQ